MPRILLSVKSGEYVITVTEVGVFINKGAHAWRVSPHVAHYVLFLILNDRVDEAVRIGLAKSHPLPIPIAS